jgi:hypothetical protein
MKDSVRVNVTVSREVHQFLKARAKLTGSTVAGSANDILIAAMVEECDRVLKAIETETDDEAD